MMRITRLARVVNGVAVDDEQVVVTQASRIKGAAATLAFDPVIGVLDEDDPGTAVNIGTPNAAILKIDMPRGRRGFENAGAWIGERAYTRHQAVRHDNCLWLALAASGDVEPGTNDDVWFLLIDGSGAAADREAAEAAAGAAGEARDDAVAAKELSEEAMEGAAIALGGAEDALGQAVAARDKAEKWADEGAGTEVEPGRYSARHHAADAGGKADLAAEWAAGTEPGGPGTKSAREYAEEAAAIADLEASAVDFTPAGSVAASNVQDAIEELDAAITASFDMDNMADGGLQVAMTVGERAKLGVLPDIKKGTVNTQTILQELAWSTGASRWKWVLEGDASLGLYFYNAGGALIARYLWEQNGYVTMPVGLRLLDSGGRALSLYLASTLTAGRTFALRVPDTNVDVTFPATGHLMREFQVGTPITATGASVTLTGLDCDDLLISGEGLSHNDGSSRIFNLLLSTDGGSTFPYSMPMGNSVSAASVVSGVMFLTGLRQGFVVGFCNVFNNGADLTSMLAGASLAYRMVKTPARVNAIRIQPAAGSFDAGTIYVSQRG